VAPTLNWGNQMKLLDEITEMASDGKHPLADALRKCLVLSFELKNDKLREWTNGELNGFDKDDELPKYRKVNLHSKGSFSGYAGAHVRNMPLPLGVLKIEDWDWLTTVNRYISK
jgi:hypothetical protein